MSRCEEHWSRARGIDASHLRASSTLGVYDGPRDLLDQLGDSPLARQA